MITNDKQYRSARAAIERLKANLGRLGDATTEVHPLLRRAQSDGLQSQIDELEAAVAEYDALQSGAVTDFEAEGLHDLPDILIRARIARRMSQKDLGAFLGIAEQQVQRYEAERYRSASLERLSEVTAALDITVRESAQLRAAPPTADAALATYPVTEMFKRGYFDDFGGNAAEARKTAEILVPAFFRQAAYALQPMALHRRTFRSGSNPQMGALAAWEARVCILADRQRPPSTFDPATVTADWLNGLVRLSQYEDGIGRARQYLFDAGIALVLEPHLPGTLLDGAALFSPSHVTIVALTLRHDRLDNFWFTLLHEIGHLALHIREGGYQAIFDDTDAPDASPIEDEADRFAQQALIPEEQWHLCVSRFTRTEKAVAIDAARLGVHSAIIAGRIRREAGDYTLLRGLVGTGEVRRQAAQEYLAWE
jgi:HTH-type transcriptional regulator/antitoxin HigA